VCCCRTFEYQTVQHFRNPWAYVCIHTYIYICVCVCVCACGVCVLGLPTSRQHTHTHTSMKTRIQTHTRKHTRTYTEKYTHYYYVYIIRRRPFCPNCPPPAPPVFHHGRPISPRIYTHVPTYTGTYKIFTHTDTRVTACIMIIYSNYFYTWARVELTDN
jgi:hypothetical protein